MYMIITSYSYIIIYIYIILVTVLKGKTKGTNGHKMHNLAFLRGKGDDNPMQLG